jgi:thymidylate synthase (FAD)
MFKLVYPIAPALFSNAGPSCVALGRCTEGKMSCGKRKEVQAKYAAWKGEGQ